MSFLDRFKSQPRWKHADAAVRAAAVNELLTDDPEQRQALIELAGDEDLRVRRAAQARIDSVEDLVRLSRSEQDEDAKRGLLDRLVGIATAPAESDGDAALALSGLDDEKQLATVAKSSPHETVRTAALGRVHDIRSLGSVARHAADPQTALDAVARIPDPAELLNIALKTDHKDAGIAALERIANGAVAGASRNTLELVSNRAKNKSVSKRARNMIQSIDETEARERAALEEWRQRIAGVVARVSALATAPVGADTRVQLADAEATWLALSSAGSFAVDPETASRYEAAVAEGRGGIERFDRELADQRAAAERRASERAARETLCQQVEGVSSEDALAVVDRARAEWEGMAAQGDAADAAASDPDLLARFEAACRRATERHANRQAIEDARARQDGVAQQAESAAAAEPFDEQAWKSATTSGSRCSR